MIRLLARAFSTLPFSPLSTPTTSSSLSAPGPGHRVATFVFYLLVPHTPCRPENLGTLASLRGTRTARLSIRFFHPEKNARKLQHHFLRATSADQLIGLDVTRFAPGGHSSSLQKRSSTNRPDPTRPDGYIPVPALTTFESKTTATGSPAARQTGKVNHPGSQT